jgi:hypothetical protein
MVPFEVSIAILNHFFGLRPEAPKFEFATDSPLEGDGFELSVPGCETAIGQPSWGAELVARIRERICGGPKVRIHLSPAASLVRTCPSSIRAPKICQSGRRHAARIPQKPSADTGARTAGAAR